MIMARTAKTNLKIKNSGVLLGSSFDTLDFTTGILGVDEGSGSVGVSATGGSTGFQQPLTGGLTGTNTWTTAPNVLVIDGKVVQKVQSDGTVMWTGTTTTVLTGAPLPIFDIFSSS